MATIQAVELPTEAQYERADQAIAEAHAAVEELKWQLWPLAESGNGRRLPARVVTGDDLAMLWSFRDGLKIKIEEAQEHAQLLGQVLSYMDAARLEGYVAEAGR